MFVSPEKYLLEIVLCPVGLGVCNDPMLAPCSHTFCRGCIELALRQTQKCPACRRGLRWDQLVPNVTAKKVIEGFRVRCTSMGCGELLRFDELDRHLKEACSYLPIKCSQGCGIPLIRKDLGSHLEKCPKSVLHCDLCGADFLREVLEFHKSDCPEVVMACRYPGCGGIFRRKELRKHLREDCAEAVIACRYHIAGCSHRGKRPEMAVHYAQKVEQHLEMTFAALVAARKEEDKGADIILDTPKKEILEKFKAEADLLRSAAETSGYFCRLQVGTMMMKGFWNLVAVTLEVPYNFEKAKEFKQKYGLKNVEIMPVDEEEEYMFYGDPFE